MWRYVYKKSDDRNNAKLKATDTRGVAGMVNVYARAISHKILTFKSLVYYVYIKLFSM